MSPEHKKRIREYVEDTTREWFKRFGYGDGMRLVAQRVLNSRHEEFCRSNYDPLAREYKSLTHIRLDAFFAREICNIVRMTDDEVSAEAALCELDDPDGMGF